MNYGEELVYWYFRFNGFFPLANFVIHSSTSNRYPSDCDVLAIRHPHVFEDIGGQRGDWDNQLQNLLKFDRTLGVICEVKTGEVGEVFPERNVNAGVERFGFFADSSNAKCALHECAQYSDANYQIAKLLIADCHNHDSNSYLFISLLHTRNFIKSRVRKYLQPKFAQRLFFKSTLLQEIIWEINTE